MNGAEAIIATLQNCGVEVCFANPGTSEMQLVAAIDQQPGMRAVLGLFEGVVTGASAAVGLRGFAAHDGGGRTRAMWPRF